MSEMKRQVLGRGLSALLDATPGNIEVKQGVAPGTLPIEDIFPGENQPRRSFPPEEIESLACSIREKGILQPILVRRSCRERGKFEIVAGERRFRAAKQIGLTEIPVVIRLLSDKEALELGLLENIQRQDLNPIEEGEAYRRLEEEFNHTQETLSRILGKSRSHIANTIRLLTLPSKVQEYLISGQLTSGHARTLVSVENPEALAESILAQGLTVRQTEELCKEKTSRSRTSSGQVVHPEKENLRHHLSELLKRQVDLILKGEGGKIIIPFCDPTDLDQLLQKFNQIRDA